MNEHLKNVRTDNLASLVRAVSKAEKAGLPSLEAGTVFIRNFTVEGIDPYLKYHLLRRDLAPRLLFGDFDVTAQLLIDPQSPLFEQKPDLVVLALCLEQLDPDYGSHGWRHDRAWERLADLLETAQRNLAWPVMVNTFVPAFSPEYGLVPPADGSDLETQVRSLNGKIRKFVLENSERFFLADWERMTRQLGRDQAMDYRYWYLSRSPFKGPFLERYAASIASVLAGLKGKLRKCLVLDCDNTLWGGIVGEVGLEGIQLDSHDYPGRIFFDFQRNLLHLTARGIMLALCSKNNEADVMEVLTDHPHCVLKPEHLSAHRINWRDKATNIRELSEELNIGLDSFAFLDDNPMECELVAGMLPDVEVLQVPPRLYQYPTLLFDQGVFDTLAVTVEDARRTGMYSEERKRKQDRQAFENLDDYLVSLETHALIHPALETELPRVAQLTRKTNQFNLTTRRYSDSEIRAYFEDSKMELFTLTAGDRFGDLGLVGVMIVRLEGTTAQVDTFLMSCRALGRDLERAFFCQSLLLLERGRGAHDWTAEYLPTLKNSQTASFWDNMGFEPVAESNAGKSYRLASDAPRREPPEFIRLMVG